MATLLTAPRWRLYRDIPQNEMDVLDAKIEDMIAKLEDIADDAAPPTDERAAQHLKEMSDRDLLAKILSVGAAG